MGDKANDKEQTSLSEAKREVEEEKLEIIDIREKLRSSKNKKVDTIDTKEIINLSDQNKKPVNSELQEKGKLLQFNQNKNVDKIEILENKTINTKVTTNQNSQNVKTINIELQEKSKSLQTKTQSEKLNMSEDNEVLSNVISVANVERTIPVFEGDNGITIDMWIKTFEEYALAYGWTEVQKFVFARNKMRKCADLFLQSVLVCDYATLKQMLMDEFTEIILVQKFIHSYANARKKTLKIYTSTCCTCVELVLSVRSTSGQ